MTRVLRRAAASAGLALCGWSTLLVAQTPTVVIPQDRPQLRRVPVAPVEAPAAPAAPAAPVVQQSPNGLYQLSITDTGIELRGPRGMVTISDTGIVIKTQDSFTLTSKDMNGRFDRNVTYRVGQNLRLDASSNITIKGHGTTDISGDGGADFTGSRLTLGCFPGKPAARVGDQVNTSTGPAAMIAQGSPLVLIC